MQATQLNPPVTYNQQTIQVPTDENKVRLEAPRYVFCIGDFIEAGDKRQMLSSGGWTGGLKIGNSTTSGAPTMWRSNFIINRACFTPLEVVATKADAGIDITPESRFPHTYQVGEEEWIRQIFPGNDIQFVTDQGHAAMGVVELTQLADTPFGSPTVYDLNRKFFPELDNWLSGNEQTPFPTLISDYVTMVEQVRAQSDLEAITQNEILESARRFVRYASEQIELNYQAIQRSRTTDMGGYGVKWNSRTKLFAAQLGRTLEDDIASKVVPVDTRSEELRLQAEANELKRRELELLALKFKAEAQIKEATKEKK